jgi:hypothetical protein
MHEKNFRASAKHQACPRTCQFGRGLLALAPALAPAPTLAPTPAPALAPTPALSHAPTVHEVEPRVHIGAMVAVHRPRSLKAAHDATAGSVTSGLRFIAPRICPETKKRILHTANSQTTTHPRPGEEGFFRHLEVCRL